ncbi:hypothetical protein K438DRAFT_1992111 [Mycena galopus ATCC 62051]|nr:hypothetical protein K438DRAFT_1992111 [Mycena galopus ATCC 62051]
MSTSPTPTISAHAARNPSKPVQPPRQRARKSDTGSSTRAVNDAKLKKEEMLAEVEAFQELRHEKAQELAIKYEKDEAYFLKLLANRSQYAATRGLTLWNAVKHDFSKQAKESGDSKSTIELNEELKYKYEELKESMSEDKKKELLAQLEEHRELQCKGVRATSKSASADAMQNAAHIGQVMKDLYERTGVRAFAMFTRGNPDDPSVPHIEDSDEARLFFLEVLKVDILDVMRKFEQWSCTRDFGGPKENHKLSVIMKEISEILTEGLQKIKNDKSLSMEYVNYRYAIVHQLGVELAGWPSWVEMTRTSKLSAEHACDIHQKLRSGAIHWVALTKAQRDAVAQEIEAERAQGPLKPRKERRDKGETRGPYEKADKNNNNTPSVANAAGSSTPPGVTPSVVSAAGSSTTNTIPATGPTVANDAVPSATNTAGCSTPPGVLSVANDTVPSTTNTVPLTMDDVIPTAANDSLPASTHDTLSIFLDSLATYGPAGDPREFDYTELDLSLPSLQQLPEDETPFLDVWLNTSNVGNGTGDAFPPGLSVSTSITASSAFHVFSVNDGNTDAGNAKKRPREKESGAAPSEKKPRKKRSDAGETRGPQQNRSARPRQRRSNAGIPRVPRTE